MLLNQLSEKEKIAFMSLGYHAAMANGIIKNEESAMLQEYCREMGLPAFIPDAAMPMEQVTAVCADADPVSKKILLLELLGLLHADGEKDKMENAFLAEWVQKVGLTLDDAERMETLVERYLKVVGEIMEEVGK